MKATKHRITSAVCALAIICGMLFSAAPITALSANPVEDIQRNVPAHDISVMSFNVLEYDTHSSGYAPGNVRIEGIIKTVETYMPDIVGMQEVSDAHAKSESSDTYGYLWKTNMPTRMAALGYSCRSLHEETTNAGANNTISAGLMIFYKTDRFSLATDRTNTGSGSLSASCTVYYDDGSLSSILTGGKKTKTDDSRYYQWVALRDSMHNNRLFYVFNTHLSINQNIDGDGDKTSNADFVAGAIIRTKQAKALAEVMKSKASTCPCFATGDYNSAWERCTLDYSYTKNYNNENSSHKVTEADICQLEEMTKSGYFADAGRVARHRVSTSPESVIDHIFFNNLANEAVETRTIYDTFNSVQPSDHRAVLTYFNYRVGADITPLNGSYDVVGKQFIDTSANASYTFDISLWRNELESATVNSFSILNDKGTKLVTAATAPATVTLDKRVNEFTLQFHNNTTGSYAFNTVKATVYYTGAATPTVTGGLNSYFAKNAWHVVVNKSTSSATIKLTGTDGKLYTDKNCSATTSLTLSGIAGGVTTYYIKSTAGEVFPVMICKESATISTDSKTLYCDDDIDPNATGTVAFIKDDQTVILGAAGTRMFGTFQSAMTKASSNGNPSTVIFAGGEYDGSNGSSTSACGTISLLGNNAGISPLVASDSGWKLSTERNEESVIKNGIQLSGNRTCNYTIKGFSFKGAAQGAILITNPSSASNTYVHTYDFEQNIFADFCGTKGTNDSMIHLNSSWVPKKGVIRDNYFCSAKDTAMTGTSVTTTTTRGIFCRNADGLTIEKNYFVDFQYPLYLMSEPVASATMPGNANFDVQYNRFDNCGQAYFYISCIGNDTGANAKFLYNDFVRCSAAGASGSIYVTMNESSLQNTNFANCELTVFGNRFTDCQRGLSIYRTTGSLVKSDASLMRMHINQNRFLQVNSTAINDSNIKMNNIILQTWLSPETYTAYQTNGTVQTIPATWDLGYNYFNASYRNGGAESTYVLPYHYINTVSKSGDTYTRYFNAVADGTLPYYSTADLSKYRSSSSSAWQTAPAVSATADNVTVNYDGAPHGITVNCSDADAVISYSTDADANRAYQSENPKFTLPGVYTVYYQAEKEGAAVKSGSATVTINLLKMSGITLSGYSGTYNGSSHNPVLKGTLPAGATVQYSTDGGAYATGVPSFKNAGTHTVTAQITAPYYETYTTSAQITIAPAALTGITVEGGYQGPITGRSYTVTVTGTLPGDSVTFAVDGAAPTATAPEFSDGQHMVEVNVHRDNYVDANYIVVFDFKETSHIDLFKLTLNEGKVETDSTSPERFKITWDLAVAYNPDVNLDDYDVNVLEYGIRYAASVDALQNYMLDNEQTAGTVAIAFNKSATGLPFVYKTSRYHLNKVVDNRSRCAIGYIRYEAGGKIYEDYSAIDATSTIWGGKVHGVGETLELDDGLED